MKKTLTGYIKAATEGSEYDGTFVLSTGTTDRDGDIIKVDGWKLENFLKNPIALWQHDHKNPVGVWENVRVDTDRLVADLKLGTTNLANMTRQLIQDGILKAVSVGFLPERGQMQVIEDENGSFKGWLIKTAELLEASLVSVPANQDALLISKSFLLLENEKAFVFEHADDSTSANPAILERAKAMLGKSALKQNTQVEEVKIMLLSDRIKAKQQELTLLRDELSKAAEIYAEDASEPNGETVTSFAASIEEAQGQLEVLQTAEKNIMSAVAQPESNKAPGIITTTKSYDPGELIFRQAAVKFLSYQSHRAESDIIRERYPNDKGLHAVMKAASVPGDTVTPGWAAELLAEQVAAFVDLLANISVYGALRSRGMSLDFAGAGSIKIPSRTTGSGAPGAFVGEGNPIPVKQLSLAGRTLTRHKMAVIVTVTEELMDATNSQIETIVRQAILDDTSKTLDVILLDATVGDAIRPGGLMNGATTTASSGATAANIIADFKAMITPFTTTDGAMDIVVTMNPLRRLGLLTVTNTVGDLMFADEVKNGTFLSYPIVESANVAADAVTAINAAEFATAFDGPSFLESNTASLHMEDTAPLPIVDGTAADPVRSLFQTYSRGIRMVLPITWDMRRTGQVSGLTGVAW